MITMKQELPNGPLSVVLLQIQYAPILDIDTYIPAIQDYCRRSGYPQTTKLRGDMIEIGKNGEVEKTIVHQWVFSSADYQRTVVIDSERLTFQVFDLTNYSFDDLLDAFLQIINTVDGLVDISLIKRLGLRYINSIEESPELSWHHAIQPEFQGKSFPDDVQWTDPGLFTWALQRSARLPDLNMNSNLLLRIYQNNEGRKYPDDILRDPRGTIDRVASGSLVTFIDLDHYILFQYYPKKKISARGKTIFAALHDVIEKVFFSSIITEEAKQLWA